MLEFLTDCVLNNIFVVLIVLLVSLFTTREYQRNKDAPPGPYGLPFVGYAFFLRRQRMSQQIGELCRKYGTDILSLNVFGQQFVALNTRELMKEVFQRRTDVADRLGTSIFQMLDEEHTGILATSGRQWKEVRRFSISTLRDFGMGRIGAEEMIQNEARILCQEIEKFSHDAYNPQNAINKSVSNIIGGMVFGKRFSHDDPEFTEALEALNSLVARWNSPLVFFIMRFKFGREWILRTRYELMMKEYTIFNDFVKKHIREHKDNYNGQTSDLIYCYLKEMEESRDPDIFNDKMLESLITDFYFAGSETTYTTLRWALLVMAAYPEIQKSVQDELDHVIGDRAACMNDKRDTPYSEAFLSEIQRHFTLTPIGAFHSNLSHDININGYTIRKGSLIVANLNEIHHDKTCWKNPDEFDPTNFLEDGRVVNLEKLVPFSIGRRACAGEALARMELYLFFVTLLQFFNIKPENPDGTVSLTGDYNVVYQPKPFKLMFKPRKQNNFIELI